MGSKFLDLYEWTLGIWKDVMGTPESSEDVFNGLSSDYCWSQEGDYSRKLEKSVKWIYYNKLLGLSGKIDWFDLRSHKCGSGC